MANPKSLTELYNDMIVPKDVEIEKQAAELVKQAEEEDAAGRIMARGFADELNKLAGPNMGENYQLPGRTAKAPSNASIGAVAGGGPNARQNALPNRAGTPQGTASPGRARSTQAAPAAPKPPKPAGGGAPKQKIGPIDTASPLGGLQQRS